MLIYIRSYPFGQQGTVGVINQQQIGAQQQSQNVASGIILSSSNIDNRHAYQNVLPQNQSALLDPMSMSNVQVHASLYQQGHPMTIDDLKARFFRQLSPEQIQHLQNSVESGNLGQFSLNELQELSAGVDAGCFGNINQHQKQILQLAIQSAQMAQSQGNKDRKQKLLLCATFFINEVKLLNSFLTDNLLCNLKPHHSEPFQIPGNIQPDAIQSMTSGAQGSGILNISQDQLKAIEAEAESAVFNKLTPEQRKELEDETRASAFMKITAQQRQEIQNQSQVAVLAQMNAPQIQVQQASNITQPHSAVVQPIVQPDLNLVVPQAAFSQNQLVSSIVITKSDGTRKEFLVNQQEGDEFENVAAKADICNQSGQSVLGVSQPFPPHALRHAQLSQLQLIQRSNQGLRNIIDLHSDTSSSLGSGARSVRSAGSVGLPSSLSATDTTRYQCIIANVEKSKC